MVTRKEFEKANKICEQYLSQLNKELEETRKRVVKNKLLNGELTMGEFIEYMSDLEVIGTEMMTRIVNILFQCTTYRANTSYMDFPIKNVIEGCSWAKISTARNCGKKTISALIKIEELTGLRFSI